MMFLQYLKRHQTFDYFCKSSHREPVWSGVGVKKLPKCFQKLSNSHGSFLHKLIYFKLAQKSPNIWATLASKFCAKNFQKFFCFTYVALIRLNCGDIRLAWRHRDTLSLFLSLFSSFFLYFSFSFLFKLSFNCILFLSLFFNPSFFLHFSLYLSIICSLSNALSLSLCLMLSHFLSHTVYLS